MNKCVNKELNLFAEWLVHFAAAELQKEKLQASKHLWFETSECAKLNPRKIIDNFQGGLAYCESINKDKWSQAPQGIARAVCQMVVYVDLYLSGSVEEYGKDVRDDLGYFTHNAAIGNVVHKILSQYGEYLTGFVSCQEMCLDDLDAPAVDAMICSIFVYRSVAMKCPIGLPVKSGKDVGELWPMENVENMARERCYLPFGYKAYTYGKSGLTGGVTL